MLTKVAREILPKDIPLQNATQQIGNLGGLLCGIIQEDYGLISRSIHDVIAEPRLDDDSAKTWYLAAAQGRDTIEVSYLDGVDKPYMEQQEGFGVDGVATKVRIDAGVAALDSRGLNKSVGA